MSECDVKYMSYFWRLHWKKKSIFWFQMALFEWIKMRVNFCITNWLELMSSTSAWQYMKILWQSLTCKQKCKVGVFFANCNRKFVYWSTIIYIFCFCICITSLSWWQLTEALFTCVLSIYLIDIVLSIQLIYLIS